MAYSCPQSIRACAARITRQDICGTALDPLVANSRIQFAAFTEITLKVDVENGADITIKNACGQICIRDKDCQRLKGFDVTFMLCGVPITVLEMLLDTTLLAAHTPGDFKGAVLRESKGATCANPKQVELWSKNSNRAQCGTGASAAYVQWLLPFTRNWEISNDLKFDYSNPLEIGLTGYAENNPNWVPSWPGSTFPSYVPGGGDPTSTPSGATPTVLPAAFLADTWTLADQTAIRAGGPLAWQTVATLPTPLHDCSYTSHVAGS